MVLGRALLVVTIAVALLGTTFAGSAAGHRPDPDQPPRPVFNQNFPDPVVVKAKVGVVGFSTGAMVPRAWSRNESGFWESAGPSLDSRPAWSREGGIWAVDVVWLRKRWVMYYSAPVRGMGEYGRCVGVATSKSVLGRFRPIGDRPLVCPAYAKVPAAQDQLLPRDRSLPKAGVIDPNIFIDRTKRVFLTYKTDKVPSTIRIVRLKVGGAQVRPGARSHELVRYPGVIENPLLVQRDNAYVMLLSLNNWTKCEYSTRWVRSRKLFDWSKITSGNLMSTANTGLCGPGGADILDMGKNQKLRMFFHGWTCHKRPTPCRGNSQQWDDNKERHHAVRSLYAAKLTWVKGMPRVHAWFGPPSAGG